jgi:integrase
VTQALREHLEAFPPTDNGLAFTAPEEGTITRTTFCHRVWMPALKRSGIEGHVRVHDLRHTAVALAIRVGAHPKEIQARARHSSIVVTMDRYGHLFPGQDEALATRLDAPVQDATWSELTYRTMAKVVGLHQRRP